jgi:hypothetical protein
MKSHDRGMIILAEREEFLISEYHDEMETPEDGQLLQK